MTTRAGELLDNVTAYRFSVKLYGRLGTYEFPTTGTNIVNLIFKNQGWYATGSVFEEWITSPAPGTVPPSGHTLTDIQHLVLQS